jgi:hypothetical protein
VALPSEHWPQAPEGWQAGVAPPQSTSPPQARQACVLVLHTGLVPPHWAFDVHGTQVPVATKQAGVAPVHLLALVAEQTPHDPLGWQAGVAPLQSLSPAQARQVWVVVLQTGVLPPHWAFETQATQLPPLVSQTGVPPLHWLALVAEHWPQAPHGSQAGVLPPHSPSPPQARQACVAVLQIGFEPLHCVFERHGTQVPDVA